MTRGADIRPCNIKKTKSPKLGKLKEKIVHFDCFEVQTIIENPLPAFSTTTNHLSQKLAQNYQAGRHWEASAAKAEWKSAGCTDGSCGRHAANSAGYFNVRYLLYTVEVTGAQNRKLKSIWHLWKSHNNTYCFLESFWGQLSLKYFNLNREASIQLDFHQMLYWENWNLKEI